MPEAIAAQRIQDATGRIVEDRWPLPIDEAFLERLLRDLFENHHEQLTFGPIIEGAAYEMKMAEPPKLIALFDGYLTIRWPGGSHVHLCIGENRGAGDAALAARRRPGRAELFRELDEDGHPRSWGFRMSNGAGEPQVSIFLPNPFLTATDDLAATPDWSRLELWDYVRTTYAGAAADGRDTLGAGFGKFLAKEFAVKA
ncbi:MAG: hypothetical protein ACLFU0_00985 [Alphaproteobacteria bacterium]